jgi:hypothetical protein
MKTTKGYFIFVQASEQKDYLSQAIALAKSIQIHNSINQVSIMTNCVMTEQQKQCFDRIYSIPGIDEAQTQEWKIQNRHKIYTASPYDETIVLDSDMLCLSNIDHWWNILKHTDLYFTNSVQNFIGETVTNNFYRKTFIKNQLPSIYCGMFYFKKTSFNNKFFALLTHVMQHYDDFALKYCREHVQKWCSLDVATAITCKILGFKNTIANKNLTFTHMKSRLQNWNVGEDWMKDMPVAYDDMCNIKINSVRQNGLLHYVQDSFLNTDIKNIVNRLWKEKTSNLA